MYAEYFELWNDLYENLRDDMARHNELVHRHSRPPSAEMTDANASAPASVLSTA